MPRRHIFVWCDLTNDFKFKTVVLLEIRVYFHLGTSVLFTTLVSGTFAYIEASYPRKPGQVARLLTPYYSGNNVAYCISFWYYMYGAHVSRLTLKLHPDNGAEIKLWYISGEQGQQWQYMNVTIPKVTSKFQVSSLSVSLLTVLYHPNCHIK